MAYLDSLHPQFDHILAFEPTGWTYSNRMLSVDNIRPRCSITRVTIYGMFYCFCHSCSMHIIRLGKNSQILMNFTITV